MECGEVGKDHGVSSKRSNLSRALRNDDELRKEDSLDRKSSEAEGWETGCEELAGEGDG